MTAEAETITFATLIERGVLGIGDGYRAKNSELNGNGPLFLRSGRVSEGRIDFVGEERFDEARASALEPKMGQPGDTVVTTKGNSTGVTAFVPEDAPPFVYSPHLSFWRSLDATVVLPGYLRYWARSPDFRIQLRALAGSTDMAPYLSLADQRRLRIRLPPIDTQRSIAGVLGALDDKIEHNDAVARRVETLLSLGFRRSFGAISGNGNLEHGWRFGTLGELGEVVMGQSPPGDSYSPDASVGPPLVQGNGDLGLRFPRPTRHTASPTKMARSGDVLVTVRAPVGEVNVADGEYCVGRGVAAFRSPWPTFASQLLLALKPRWTSEEAGTIFPSVNRSQIVGLALVIPPAQLIDEYEDSYAPAAALLGSLEREAETLREIRDALLPKLVSGAVRVPESYDPGDTPGAAEAAGLAVP